MSHPYIKKDWKNTIVDLYYGDTTNACHTIGKYCFVDSEIVQFIIHCAQENGQSTRVQFLSVDIFKLFFHYLFFETESVLLTKKVTEQKWLFCLEQLKVHFHLTVMSCIELASKYDGNVGALKPRNTKVYLEKYNLNYDSATINESLFFVFKTIRFKIPTIAIMDVVELFLCQTAPSEILACSNVLFNETCKDILLYVYLAEKYYYKRIVSSISRQPQNLPCTDIFAEYGLLLAAAIIHCAGRLLHLSKQEENDLIKFLTNYSNAIENNITALSSILYILILE